MIAWNDKKAGCIHAYYKTKLLQIISRFIRKEAGLTDPDVSSTENIVAMNVITPEIFGEFFSEHCCAHIIRVEMQIRNMKPSDQFYSPPLAWYICRSVIIDIDGHSVFLSVAGCIWLIRYPGAQLRRWAQERKT